MSHGQLNPGIGTEGLQQIMQLPILRRSPRQFDQVILKKLGILRICYDKHQKPPWSRFSVALPLTYSRGFIYSTVKSDPRTLFQKFLFVIKGAVPFQIGFMFMSLLIILASTILFMQIIIAKLPNVQGLSPDV